MEVLKSHLENMTFTERWVYLTKDANQERLEKFLVFHKSHRTVFDALFLVADEAWGRGVRTMGVRALLGKADVGLSNDHIAFYLRLLIAKFPKFSGMFTIKAMKP